MYACMQDVTKIYLTKTYKMTRERNGIGGETTFGETTFFVRGGGGIGGETTRVLGRND